MGKGSKSFNKLSDADKLTRLFDTMGSLSTNIDKQFNDLKSDFRGVSARIDKIDKKVSCVDAKYHKLQDEIKNLKKNVNDLQQAKFGDELVIRGLAEAENDENSLVSVVEQVIQRINCSHPHQIIKAERIGRGKEGTLNRPPRYVVVKFGNNLQKNAIMQAKKKIKNLNCNQILVGDRPIGTDSQIIYFDERVTKETSDLYYSARQLKRRSLIKFAWIKNGSLYIRKSENSDAIRVTEMQQIRAFEKRQLSSTLNDNSSSDDSDDGDHDVDTDEILEEEAMELSAKFQEVNKQPTKKVKNTSHDGEGRRTRQYNYRK